MKKNIMKILIASLGLVAATSVQADVIFATNPNGGWTGTGPVTFGTPFVVGASPITITSLGFFDRDNNGLGASHVVAIYNQASQTLLGQVTVQAGTASTLHDGTRWEQLGTSITLDAGTAYMLATMGGGDTMNFSQNPGQLPTLGSGFTLMPGGGFTQAPGPSIQYPGANQVTGMWLFGANMEAGASVAVPEPSQWAMMGVTLAGAAGFALRRHRAHKLNCGAPKANSYQ